jgi:hypothetical protein
MYVFKGTNYTYIQSDEAYWAKAGPVLVKKNWSGATDCDFFHVQSTCTAHEHN